ncbi:hypothetical protein BV900_17090 [Agrobacterium tumefaciens]|nr:hypothetical protein BV900_17090 [Agrobacterium tumefaciens]
MQSPQAGCGRDRTRPYQSRGSLAPPLALSIHPSGRSEECFQAEAESITTTRHYAETTAATLRRKFDQVTAPAARFLLSGIQHSRGDDAALLAADLLSKGRSADKQITSADT